MKKREKQLDSLYPRDNAIAQRVLHYSSRFLEAPLVNLLRYYGARFVLMLPGLPKKSREKFGLSERKRDFRLLSRLLMEQPDSGRPGSHADFRSTQARKRQQVLLGAEHMRLMAARQSSLSSATITISLVTYQSARWLDGFFASLLSQGYPLNLITLHIVDHGSTDSTVLEIQRFFTQHGSRFRSVYLVERVNDGFGGGHNFNIRASDDAFVLVSNVDLEFGVDTLNGLVAAARADADDVACWEARQCPFEHPKFYDPVTLETAWCSHACILLRRSAYEAVGGYEDRIFMYGEDVELSYRLRGAGWRLRYLPYVPVRHFVSFTDPSLRPHQLTGSLSANVLLRYRFGGEEVGKAGEAILEAAVAHEADALRKSALLDAQRKIDSNREYYRTKKLPVISGVFPFDGLDYEIGRMGHDTALDSLVPLPELPRVTIITRTYGPNQGILREAIVSVLNQTYENIEHLIVEDRGNQSEAMVAEIAEAYQANIRFLRSDRGGRSAAGNTGLAASKGELLLFLDNDDLLFADHVELLVRALSTTPDAVAAYSLAWEVESFFSASGAYREGTLTLHPGHAKPYSARRLQQGNFLPIQSVLFRRSVYERENGIDEQIDHLEDWNLWARYAQYGDFQLVPKITSIYRVPGDPVFKEERRLVMQAAEDVVRHTTFRSIALRKG